MSLTASPTILGWLAGVSVPLAVASLKYAFSVNNKFIKLSTLFDEQTKSFSTMQVQQKEDGIKLAVHDQIIRQMQSDVASINIKLEPLPRITAMLENILPTLQGFVPRQEIEHRFRGLEQTQVDLRAIITK